MIEVIANIKEGIRDLENQVLDIYDDYLLTDHEIVNCDVVGNDGKVIPVLIECRTSKKGTYLYVTNVEKDN